MNESKNAGREFPISNSVAKLLLMARDERREWDYEIKANTVIGPEGKSERHPDGQPKLTGGYEIHIIIHPPKADEIPARN